MTNGYVHYLHENDDVLTVHHKISVQGRFNIKNSHTPASNETHFKKISVGRLNIYVKSTF